MRGAASASISQTNETGSARAATTRFARDSSADTPTAIAVAGTWVRVGTVVTVAAGMVGTVDAAASTRILRRLVDSKRATSRVSKTPATGIATIRSARKTTARATTATTADSARATSGRS